MKTPKLHRITFHDRGRICELYARSVSQGALLGFIEIGDFVFGARSAVLVDPGEEQLRSEFAGVARTWVPLHAVVRIDEVEQAGVARILPGSAQEKVRPFPLPPPPAAGRSDVRDDD